MSQKVKERLDRLRLETTHEERREIDRLIEERTHQTCDEGVEKLSLNEFIEIVKRAKKKKQPIEIYA